MAYVEIGITGTIAQGDDEIGGTRWHLEGVAKLGVRATCDGAKVDDDGDVAG